MKKYKFAALFVIIVGVCFYMLNVWTPENGDDYTYKFMCILDIESHFDLDHPIRTLPEIFISQFHHYFIVNGRVIVHIFVQLFTGLLGKSVFNIFNALFFCGFIYAIQKYVTKSFGDLFFLSITVFFIVLLLPSFNETFLWMTGSMNYLWVSSFVMLFLIELERVKDKTFSHKHIAYLFPGLLVGWTHEGITFPLAISLIVYMVWNYKKIWKSAAFPLIVGFIVGALLCAFAPGILHRASQGSSTGILRIISILVAQCTILRIFYLLVILLVFRKHIGYKDSLLHFFKENCVLVGGILFSFGIVLVADTVNGRVVFGLEFFSLLLVLKFLHGIKFSERVRKSVIIGTVSLFVILIGVITPYSLANYREYESLVSQLKTNEDYVIQTNEVKCPFPRYIQLPLGSEESEFYRGFSSQCYPYMQMAAAYQRDSIVCLPQRFVEDVRMHPSHYEHFYTNETLPFYARRIEKGIQVDCVTYLLRETERDEIPFYFRPFADRLQRYSATQIDTDRYDKVYIDNECYLLVGKNQMIDNRVQDLQINDGVN